VKVQGSPAAIAAGFNRVWVVGHRNGVVYEIDPATARVAHAITVGGTYYTGLAAADGFVWTVRDDTKSLVKIDPRTSRVAATKQTRVSLTGLTPTGNALWAIEPERRALVRIDTKTMALRDEIRLPASFADAATEPIPDGSALWLGGTKTIAKVDLGSMRPVDQIRLPDSPGSIAVTDDAIFFVYPNSTALYRVAPDGGHAVRVGYAAPQPGIVKLIDGRLYVTDDKVQSVTAIDPATGKRLATVVLRRGPPPGNQLPDTLGLVGIARSGGALWLPDWAANAVYRVPVSQFSAG
jgi:DNA-binding beta-propeller fold protein YncE